VFVNFYHLNGITIFTHIYVDNIVITSSSQRAVDAVLADLCMDFGLQDLGSLHYILDIEVNFAPDGISYI
jgi:hypothetical protein